MREESVVSKQSSQRWGMEKAVKDRSSNGIHFDWNTFHPSGPFRAKIRCCCTAGSTVKKGEGLPVPIKQDGSCKIPPQWPAFQETPISLGRKPGCGSYKGGRKRVFLPAREAVFLGKTVRSPRCHRAVPVAGGCAVPDGEKSRPRKTPNSGALASAGPPKWFFLKRIDHRWPLPPDGVGAGNGWLVKFGKSWLALFFGGRGSLFKGHQSGAV